MRFDDAYWNHECEAAKARVTTPLPASCHYCGKDCHEIMRALWERLYAKDAPTGVSSGAASGAESLRNVFQAPDEEGVETNPAVSVLVRAEIEKSIALDKARAEVLGAAIALKNAANEYAQQVSNSGADIEDAYFSKLVPAFERVARSVLWPDHDGYVCHDCGWFLSAMSETSETCIHERAHLVEQCTKEIVIRAQYAALVQAPNERWKNGCPVCIAQRASALSHQTAEDGREAAETSAAV